MHQERVVAEYLDHELYGIPPRAPDAGRNIYQLITDLSTDIDPCDVREVDEDRKVPLEIRHVVIRVL